jgi:hypothetical protein
VCGSCRCGGRSAHSERYFLGSAGHRRRSSTCAHAQNSSGFTQMVLRTHGLAFVAVMVHVMKRVFEVYAET